MKASEDVIKNQAVPPAELLKLLILERRENVLDAFESYERDDLQGCLSLLI
jgi:hypothetical protein